MVIGTFNKSTSVFHASVLFRHCFDNVITKFIVNNRTNAWKTDVNLLLTMTNCQIVRSRSLTHRINYKFMCLSAYWQWKLANERARILAVIVKKRNWFIHTIEQLCVTDCHINCSEKKVMTSFKANTFTILISLQLITLQNMLCTIRKSKTSCILYILAWVPHF